MKTTDSDKQRFIDAFEAEFDDKVISFELAELHASPVVFEILNLKPKNNVDSMWGLIVFCESETYFYSFPQENMLSFYIRKSSDMDPPVAQCVSLSEWRCRYRFREKTFFDFLFPRRQHLIKAYFFDKNKISHTFELYMTNKAADVIGSFPLL